jgi:hypothetical protein
MMQARPNYNITINHFEREKIRTLTQLVII